MKPTATDNPNLPRLVHLGGAAAPAAPGKVEETGIDLGALIDLVLKHAGQEVLEVYGRPNRLAEVEAEAGAAGLRTRRTGTSISILGVDGTGSPVEGERRPANLEDVFVLLTGEEID